ncbi:MAG: NAD(P)-dependent alcohol dehydrogenase [Anaerolineae bacterium]|nr:NAD(P)-dependent alcohol dehydrogenase [Anaerolineae bacterium]
MKAIICTKYGPPEMLQFQDAAKPTPKDDEVLIKVHAASVTPSDCAFRKADPFIIRLMYGLTRPKFLIPGVEFAGQIEAMGKNVTQFKQGDPVYGISPDHFGAQAEYMCLSATKPCAIKPANASYAETVAICDGALTALIFLRDVAKLQHGQKILINGASGAVGVYAVQLAKYYGAHVTGVCSTSNLSLVISLGADEVIDYTQTDFTKNGQAYDVIFDTVSKRSFSQCKGSLTANGMYLSTVPTLTILLQMLWTANFGSKKAKFVASGLMQNKDNLNFITHLIETGVLKAVIDRHYPLAQVAEAHRYVETGRKKGNVVITI